MRKTSLLGGHSVEPGANTSKRDT